MSEAAAPTAEFNRDGTLRRRARDRDLVPTLTIIEGPDLGQIFPLHEGRRAFRAGRSEEVEIRLDAASVSRQHALFTVHYAEDRQRVRVEDLGSTNGVFHNLQPVTDAWLMSGDKVRIGDFILRFEWMNAEEVQYHEQVSQKLRDVERDPLTGLYMRRMLEERVPRLAEGWLREGSTASCLLVDLDHFKTINDTWGHLVGDAVLRAAAQAVTVGLRKEDLAVRYGGEEMLVLLPRTGLHEAAEIAARVCQALRQMRLSEQGPDLVVTASVGVAERVAEEEVAAWIHRCDEALYEAKHGGRDRVVLAQAEGQRGDPKSTRSLRAAPKTVEEEPR